MEPSIFTKIIAGEVPGVIVWQDEHIIVLMDKFPAVAGQTLVIPKEQIDSLWDLPEELYTKLWSVARLTARAMDQAFSPRRVCVVVEGFEVPHAHIRLYPVPEGTPLTLTPHGAADDETLETEAAAIREFFQAEAAQ